MKCILMYQYYTSYSWLTSEIVLSPVLFQILIFLNDFSVVYCGDEWQWEGMGSYISCNAWSLPPSGSRRGHDPQLWEHYQISNFFLVSSKLLRGVRGWWEEDSLQRHQIVNFQFFGKERCSLRLLLQLGIYWTLSYNQQAG